MSDSRWTTSYSYYFFTHRSPLLFDSATFAPVADANFKENSISFPSNHELKKAAKHESPAHAELSKFIFGALQK